MISDVEQAPGSSQGRICDVEQVPESFRCRICDVEQVTAAGASDAAGAGS